MITFKFEQDYYDPGDVIYQYKSLTLKPGVTILAGCNGSGKSTMLSIMRYYCAKHKVECRSYNDNIDGRSNALSALAYSGDYSGFAANWISSEGEKIRDNIGRFARNLRNIVLNNEKSVLLFDGVDSGQSIDGILDIVDLFNCIAEDAENAGKECYIVVTANTYALARSYRCVDITTGKRKTFRSYGAYEKFILASSAYKRARYEKINESNEP